MSNIILQSGENSSLLQTLNNSDSKRNPSIYNTKEVYPNSATTWINIDPQSAVPAKNGASQTFALPKYGILQQILLSVSKTATRSAIPIGEEIATIPAGDIFNCIDRIEFLSSSRVLSTLYSQDLQAQYSNLSADQLNPIVYTSMNAFPTSAAVGSQTISYCIPIVFGFNQDINTMMNLSFNEPSQLRVVWSQTEDIVTTAAGVLVPVVGIPLVTTAMSSPTLGLRYSLYGEADTAEMLSANFSSDQLNMLTTRFYRENPVTFKGKDTNNDVQLIIRNIDVAKAFYVMCRRSTQASGALLNPNKLAPIQSVRIEASGQVIAEITHEQSMYSKLTENGFSINPLRSGTTDTNNPIGLENIFKIQTGLWEHSGGGPWSNGYSLREMNNVVIKVSFLDGAVDTDVEYQLFVEEETSTVIAVNSASGRVVNALSN